MVETKKRGRPLKNDRPMTATERKQRHREKLAEIGKVTITIELPSIVVEVIDKHRALLANIGKRPALSRSEQIESSLLSWAIDAGEAMPKLIEMCAAREKREAELSTSETEN